jgi:aspartate/methionine/tyrosine aminotransferase
MPDSAPHSATARAAVRSLVASQIREVANAGMGEADILPFWFGEPDEVAPAFIRDAAAASLRAARRSIRRTSAFRRCATRSRVTLRDCTARSAPTGSPSLRPACRR